MMAFTGLSNKSIARSLQSLRESGIIAFDSRNGSRTSYVITAKSSVGESQVSVSKPVTESHSLNGSSTLTTSDTVSKTCEPVSTEPVTLCPKPVTEDHINRKEPEIKPEGTGSETADSDETKSFKLESETPDEKTSKPKRAKPQPITDDEWLSSLEQDDTYRGIDVRREFGKMKRWCEVKRKLPSRARFLNWLNRAEPAMTTADHDDRPTGI